MTDRKTVFDIDKDTLRHLYIDKGLSMREISRIFGCSETTIFNRLGRFGIPTRARRNDKITKETLEKLYAAPMTHKDISKIYGLTSEAIRYYFDKFGIKSRPHGVKIHPVLSGFAKDRTLAYDNLTKVDLSPSPELCYILGVYFGDATLDHRQYITQLVVKDKDFCEEFVRCFSKISNKTYAVHTYGKYFRARPASKQFYEFIVGKTVADLTYIIREYPCDFVRGFFDSEGGVSKEGNKIRMANTDLSLLEYIQSLLSNLGIMSAIHCENKVGEVITGMNGKAYTKTKNVYRLQILTKGASRFAELISSSIKRKKDRLERCMR